MDVAAGICDVLSEDFLVQYIVIISCEDAPCGFYVRREDVLRKVEVLFLIQDVQDWEQEVETGEEGRRDIKLVRKVLGLVEPSMLWVGCRDYCGFCLEFCNNPCFCN